MILSWLTIYFNEIYIIDNKKKTYVLSKTSQIRLFMLKFDPSKTKGFPENP